MARRLQVLRVRRLLAPGLPQLPQHRGVPLAPQAVGCRSVMSGRWSPLRQEQWSCSYSGLASPAVEAQCSAAAVGAQRGLTAWRCRCGRRRLSYDWLPHSQLRSMLPSHTNGVRGSGQLSTGWQSSRPEAKGGFAHAILEVI